MSDTPSQTNRLLKIKAPVGDFVLRRLTVREAVGECFLIEAEVLSADGNLDPASVVGKAVTCSVVHAEHPTRHFHGIVHAFARIGTSERSLTTYRLEARPRFFNLSRTRDCRIFQKKSVKDIVQTLVAEGSADPIRFGSVDASPREYCTQYDETDLDFLSRLMGENGWAWWFQHDDGQHTLHVGAANADFPMIPGEPQTLKSEHILEIGMLWDWHRWSRLPTGKVVALDHDHPKLATDIRSETNTIVFPGQSAGAESFLFPSSKSVRPEVDPAKLAMESAEAASELVSATGNDPLIFAGGRLRVQGGPAAGTWVVSEVIHDAVDETHLEGGGLPSYGNRVVLMPTARPWRPHPLPRRPVIPGLQWAKVTGPAGEEIHTDAHGRIKVHFMWDRLGAQAMDDTTSRWCSLLQGLAGAWGGMQHIPRVGDWVAVGFLHGDPDHPVVLGSLYASDAPPPFSLPGKKTQSGYKTRSTKQGGADNFNMLMFEDNKGSELVQMQAEKDYDVLVKHDTTIYTKNNHTEKVGNNRTTTIEKGNEKLTVSTGNMETEVSMGNQTNTVKMGNITEKASLGKIDVEAMQSITLKVGANTITIDQTGITLKGIMIKIEGTAMLQTKAPMAQHNADAMMIIKGGIVMIN